MVCSCNTEEEIKRFKLLPASKSGINFENTLTESDSLNILDYLYFYNGGGLAMGDINNDGLPDLFFAANQKTNTLYLNKGGLHFEDISISAGIVGNSSWNTGAVMADVNGDGWLDIYVLAVEGINGFTGHNELYINNKNNTFTESAAKYGLDLKCFGTTASFFDYDLDGDLDVYVLNHAVHTQESFGRAEIRNTRNAKTGDRLLRNDGNNFTDVSEEAGIYGGINGYGLGLATSDFNNDGYPDIYVGNDFHEDDYYYINNGDGTFTESLKKYFGHTSRFSMGNDVADINHDGLPDLISLDMLPEDETVLKSSEGDDTYQTLKMRTQQFGYHYQFTRNMLYVNQAQGPFTETALMSGIAATDWSWSALFGDYDQDGEQDLFISNGIPKRPNDLDFIRFVSSDKIRNNMNESRLIDQKAMDLMPDGMVKNYVFQGDGTAGFTDQSSHWLPDNKSVSGATAIGDLDGDGDLDIVTNNINEAAGVYVNNTNNTANYLKIQLRFKDENPFGIGSKVILWNAGKQQFKELFSSRGWQASSDPVVHFGLGSTTEVDSVTVIWPDKTYQSITKVAVNRTIMISPKGPKPYSYSKTAAPTLFAKVNGNLGINYIHRDDNVTDFDYQKLIPYKVSDHGPDIMVEDLNNDGKADIYITGNRSQEAAVFLQKNTGFERNDPKKLLLPEERLYDPGKTALKVFGTTRDRKQLCFETTAITPIEFGELPDAFIRLPDGNKLALEAPGMIRDAVWTDFDNDGTTDLIVVGEWMPPRFYKLVNDTVQEVFPLNEALSGLWQSILPFDIDKDGDMDYLLGNWGLNTKFTATRESPLRMYYDDFDKNGRSETVVACSKNGRYYPLMGLNELSAQMTFLRKKFTDYKSFAGKSMQEVFGGTALESAQLFEVHTLASGYLLNNNNTFTFTSFPGMLQTAPICAFVAYDFDGDNDEEVLAAGNYFGIIPFHGRFDGFGGGLIVDEKTYRSGATLGLDLTMKSARHLNIIEVANKPYLLILFNNDDAQLYEINK
jgi:hypothetical protein